MVTATAARVTQGGLPSVVVEQRDFVADGCSRPAGSVGFAMLFNTLHIENPVSLLTEAHRVVRPGGRIGVIHWIYDVRTPRGPPLSIRPRPEQCRAWAAQASLQWICRAELPGAPWHWGVVLESP